MKRENNRYLYRYLLQDKIDIYVDNIHKFQEIALLVDNPELLTDVRFLRQELGIKAPVIDFKKNIGEIFGKEQKTLDDWIVNHPSIKKSFQYGVNRIMRKFKCPLYLQNAVIQAILLKAVVDYSGIIKIIEKDTYIKHPVITILPTPHTTYTEIEEALREVKRLFKLFSHTLRTTKFIDTTPNISKKYRDWYWERLSGKKFVEIADEWNKQHNDKTNTTEDDVIKAVEYYQKLLRK